MDERKTIHTFYKLNESEKSVLMNMYFAESEDTVQTKDDIVKFAESEDNVHQKDIVQLMDSEKVGNPKSNKKKMFFVPIIFLVVIIGIIVAVTSNKSTSPTNGTVSVSSSQGNETSFAASVVLSSSTASVEYKTITYDNGDVYEGEVKNGQRSGKGL